MWIGGQQWTSAWSVWPPGHEPGLARVPKVLAVWRRVTDQCLCTDTQGGLHVSNWTTRLALAAPGSCGKRQQMSHLLHAAASPPFRPAFHDFLRERFARPETRRQERHIFLFYAYDWRIFLSFQKFPLIFPLFAFLSFPLGFEAVPFICC